MGPFFVRAPLTKNRAFRTSAQCAPLVVKAPQNAPLPQPTPKAVLQSLVHPSSQGGRKIKS